MVRVEVKDYVPGDAIHHSSILMRGGSVEYLQLSRTYISFKELLETLGVLGK